MTLEQQVVSLDLAEKLKKLGVKQESAFVHAENDIWYATALDASRADGARISARLLEAAQERFSAFTVAELGEMLPSHIFTEDKHYQLRLWSGVDNGKRFWSIGYDHFGNQYAAMFSNSTEADARAKNADLPHRKQTHPRTSRSGRDKSHQ